MNSLRFCGVEDELDYLAKRHDLVLMTKGNTDEQSAKLEKSGLGGFFCKAVIVREKDAAAYRRVVEEHTWQDSHSWMVGNSPKSDINPALEAGIGAVYVPHPRTWHLENQEVVEGERLLVVERFGDLVSHF